MVKLVRMARFVALLLAIGGSAFLVGRVFLAQERRVEAKVTLPMKAIEPAVTLPEQGPAKPFEGDLNGFTFYTAANFDTWALLSAHSLKCSGSTATGNNIRYATEKEGIASRLNFTITYLPPGAEERYVAVSACEDDVIAMSREYRVQNSIVQVGRVVGPPFVRNSRTRDLLEATTISGRPAVIAKPRIPNPKGRMAIYLRDDYSIWTISGFQISLEELTKIAEGVK